MAYVPWRHRLFLPLGKWVSYRLRSAWENRSMSDSAAGDTPGLEIVRVDARRLPEVVAVHCAAFCDYPTMHYVLGAGTSGYSDRLAALISFFIDTTYLKGGTVLAVEDNGTFVAAADAVRSDSPEPQQLTDLRQALWQRLGEAARERYATYHARTQPFTPAEPHYYLSMLGVRPEYAGRGLARPLLERVNAIAQADKNSTGVALETENPNNVGLYEHFGYRLVGQVKVGDAFESWGFFRPHS